MREDQMSKLDRGLVTSASWDTECLKEFQSLTHTCMGHMWLEWERYPYELDRTKGG